MSQKVLLRLVDRRIEGRLIGVHSPVVGVCLYRVGGADVVPCRLIITNAIDCGICREPLRWASTFPLSLVPVHSVVLESLTYLLLLLAYR